MNTADKMGLVSDRREQDRRVRSTSGRIPFDERERPSDDAVSPLRQSIQPSWEAPIFAACYTRPDEAQVVAICTSSLRLLSHICTGGS